VIRNLFDGASPIVVAHRGLALDKPENTLPAFQAAIDVGADMLETDVHVSADGVVVVAHDHDLSRLSGRTDSIASLTYSQLRNIDLGGAHLPTLAELLGEFPEAPFSIDVKADGAEAAVAEVIRAARAEDRVMVASFSERRRVTTLQSTPGAASAGTTRHVVSAYIASRLAQPSWARRELRGIDALFVPQKALGLRLDTKRFAADLASVGVVLGIWTINDPVVMREMWSNGVRAIVTDRTDLAVEAKSSL
jgi:glycerophosphoryl diester phosphodiesterase